ncbi:imidazole glycerol phosphate synthase subunit HisH [Denitrobaculum tricleocarpae]|uniref:Imidazole glycerol phosphate synthase subunit HisH n=1 Tax=Denitrobaculum tricleocarpae TaxID=2591009 RepID=A0A545TRK7_9PROT|nr:imidazole glycerol phosphate synthase subunit HisH [Denitrobaculum tricleocarpae]TQV79852.1 imidazole glycerol phosphate synthase subunit HisH [Denitrobaculum tricleocarpae]
MTVALIDYGSGNLHSAAKALERAAFEAGLSARITVTSDPEVVRLADRIVLPGVGAFADCRKGLGALPGMVDTLEERVIRAARPFLGICVGMQLMASVGREHGDCEGLGWIPGEVVAMTPTDTALKVPHMGWNQLEFTGRKHPVLAGMGQHPHVYFVHSYHLVPNAQDQVLATVDYGGRVTAVVGRDNLVGTQFHPEKSQTAGLQLLGNFLKWTP